MTRILVLLAADTWQEACSALHSARENAASPNRLTYGVSLAVRPTDEEQAAMHALGTVIYLAPEPRGRHEQTEPAPVPDIWRDMERLWHGEAYVLLGHPAMQFARSWDHALLRALKWCQRDAGEKCALTGYLPRQIDPVDAVYPVAASRIDRRGRLHYQRGTPLRYARTPQRSAFLHPNFCFAPSAFFRGVGQAQGPRFMAACEQGWALYTLHQSVIRLLWDDDEAPLPDDVTDCPASRGCGAFETRFSIRFAEKKLSEMARCGIFHPDLTFDTYVPLMVRAQEAFRSVDNRTVSDITPMCVTAWLTLPGIRLSENKLRCFRRLSAMKSLPLVCFTDGESARRVMLSHSNLQDYRQRHGLNVPIEAMQEDWRNYVRLSKPFMLAQCRESTLCYSHYIWLNFDYMRYPVYERAALDWQNVCLPRIAMAEVDGRLDPSMIVVPQALLDPLCQRISDICQDMWRRGLSLPTEQELWLALLRERPDWFQTIPLPSRRELLALTMTTRGEEFHTEA